MRPESWKIGMSLAAAAVAAGTLMASSPAGRPLEISLAPAVDAASLDEGLDVRDAQGRPVAAPAQKQQLRRLFVGSLFALLTTPRLPQALALLDEWRGWAEWFRRPLTAAWSAFLDLFTPPARRRLFSFSAVALWAMALGFAAVLFSAERNDSRLNANLTKLTSTVIRR
jgi:hypothetical protein